MIIVPTSFLEKEKRMKIFTKRLKVKWKGEFLSGEINSMGRFVNFEVINIFVE
jgi:hypothetical protein